jgi:hypothetical protein
MKYTIATMTGAASSRQQLATVQFLRAQRCPWDWRACQSAAQAGALQTLQWLREQGCDWGAEYILHSAASSGSIELTAWVLAQPGVIASEAALITAAKAGDMPMCQFLRAEQLPWTESTTSAAAAGNHVGVLDWLREQGCPWDAQLLCIAAAEGDSVEVLQHLQQHDGVQCTAAQLRYKPTCKASMFSSTLTYCRCLKRKYYYQLCDYLHSWCCHTQYNVMV